MSILWVQQKKGDPNQLDGRLTVYARLDVDPGEMLSMKHPVASMVHNGLLVAQGNFREQNSLRDFLKSEMGLSLEEGLEQLLERMDGLESALDPEKLKEKLADMGEMEEFIPTPAKIVAFHSEKEIMEQEGDVFFTGDFRNAGSAVLSVNALPILYQARYREQEMTRVRSEIETLISQIERAEVPQERYSDPKVDVETKVLKEFIPSMLYCRRDKAASESAERQFRMFLSGYPYPEDVDSVVRLIRNDADLTSRHYKLLELLARKMGEVKKEDFAEVEKTQRRIKELL